MSYMIAVTTQLPNQGSNPTETMHQNLFVSISSASVDSSFITYASGITGNYKKTYETRGSILVPFVHISQEPHAKLIVYCFRVDNNK